MVKRSGTTEEAEAIAKGMAIAKEIDEQDGRDIAEDVVEEAEAKAAETKAAEAKAVQTLPIQPKPRTRKTFDHTGVQPMGEPKPGVFEAPELHGNEESPPMMTVTTTRSLTMGDVVHPQGATISVPVVYAESLIKSGAATVALEQPRPPEPPVEPEEPEAVSVKGKRHQPEHSPDPDEN